MDEKINIEDEIRKFDESMTGVLRTIPGFLWGLFKSLHEQGFTEPQALQLTMKYMEGLHGKQ